MFKIFSPSQNKFSNGGIVPSFNTAGKFWMSVGTLKNHLLQYTFRDTDITADHYKPDDVVIEYKLIEINRTTVKEWMKEHETKHT